MMNITLTLNSDDLRRLEKLVIKDTDTADKHALEGILWEIANKAGICDDSGNLTSRSELKCNMIESCTESISYIDDSGFIYCKCHGLQRQAYRRCRKLRPHEIKRLQSGLTIKKY